MITHHFFDIDEKLRGILQKVERSMQVKFDPVVIASIFTDAEENQVSFKYYELYRKVRPFWFDWIIEGTVDECEPDYISIQIKGSFRKKKAFDELLNSLQQP